MHMVRLYTHTHTHCLTDCWENDEVNCCHCSQMHCHCKLNKCLRVCMCVYVYNCGGCMHFMSLIIMRSQAGHLFAVGFHTRFSTILTVTLTPPLPLTDT